MHNVEMINFRHVEVIRAVAKSRSISLAASKLCLSQSQTSRLLADAERILSVRLFDRTNRGITLTAPGENALQLLSEVALSLEEATVRIQASATGGEGLVRLGYSSFSYAAGLPMTLRVVREVFPRSLVTLTRAPGATLLKHLRSMQVDLALLHPPGELSGVELKPILRSKSSSWSLSKRRVRFETVCGPTRSLFLQEPTGHDSWCH